MHDRLCAFLTLVPPIINYGLVCVLFVLVFLVVICHDLCSCRFGQLAVHKRILLFNKVVLDIVHVEDVLGVLYVLTARFPG